MFKKILLILILALLGGCTSQVDLQRRAQAFLDDYTKTYQKLYYASSRAEWRANTYIAEGDTVTEKAVRKANEALADFTGSVANIKTARDFLKNKENLTPLQVRQFETILYNAANNPQTVADLVSERIKAESEQTKKLFGFSFTVDGHEVSTNDIDEALKNETNLKKRLKVWEASKEVGKALKPGLTRLQALRNKTVQALGYKDYFSYQVSDYGMTTDEMMAMNRRFIEEVRPLYRELHTYIRYTLAKKYGTKVPKYIPAHWLPNRWGQDWSALVHVKGIDLDAVLKSKGAEWLVKQAERFYVSLGFSPLPASFYERSSLYPLPPDAGYKKNNHASAWHLDLDKDIRSLMSVIPNAEWYETTHHELGHIYYYISYSTAIVPILLRGGANRAFHEAIGSMMGLAAMQKPFLENLKLIPEHTVTDTMQTLLREALNYIVFIPWSAGVMTDFEKQLYADDLSPDRYNATWWALKKKYQGIAPPTERDERFCDAASKTHINDDAAQYYDYALSYIILFQIHDYIARNILHQPPQATNYYGNKEVGRFLKKILSPGATVDWRRLMRETLGEEISARPMLNYFKPLMKWLKKENTGRKHSL